MCTTRLIESQPRAPCPLTFSGPTTRLGEAGHPSTHPRQARGHHTTLCPSPSSPRSGVNVSPLFRTFPFALINRKKNSSIERFCSSFGLSSLPIERLCVQNVRLCVPIDRLCASSGLVDVQIVQMKSSFRQMTSTIERFCSSFGQRRSSCGLRRSSIGPRGPSAGRLESIARRAGSVAGGVGDPIPRFYHAARPRRS